MCSRGVHPQLSVDWYPQSIPSINILDWCPWSTLDWYSIATPSTPRLILDLLLGRGLVMSWLIFDPCMWVGWHSTDYPPTVDQVLIECQSRYWWSVDQVSIGMSVECQSRCQSWVDWGYRLTLDCGCLWYTWSSELQFNGSVNCSFRVDGLLGDVSLKIHNICPCSVCDSVVW